MRTFSKVTIMYVAVAILTFSINTKVVEAQQPECSETYLKDVHAQIINCSGSNTTEQCGPGVSGNRVMYVGDSLTFGMVTLGQLLDKTEAAGFDIDANYTEKSVSDAGDKIRVTGDSIEAVGGYSIWNILPMLEENPDGSSLAYQRFANADKIVIGLGTNQENNFVSKITELVEIIRSKNPSAQIYWVNTYFKPDENTYKTINSDIESAARQSSFNIIDFAMEATSNPDMVLAGDQVHHGANAYKAKSDFVISQIGNNSTDGSSCNSTLTGDNEKDVYTLLTRDYGLTPEQAAGIIANMRHESGVEAMRLQGTPPGTETPSANVDIAGTRGKGWGLVQWTPTGKIIEQSFIRSIPYATIDTVKFQVDFLMGQLLGEGLGGEISNESGRAGNKFFATTTVQEAASVFAIDYERCAECSAGTAEVQARIDEAVAVLATLGSL